MSKLKINNNKLFKKLALGVVLITTTLGGIMVYENKNSTNKTPDTTIDINDDNNDELQNLNVELLPFSNLYVLNSKNVKELQKLGYDVSDTDEEYDLRSTPVEFESIIGYADSTWDDIRTALDNSDLTDEVKTLIHKNLIDKLEQSNHYVNKGILRYNLEHIKMKEVDSIDNASGLFDPFECCIYINKKCPKDVREKTIIHEITHAAKIAFANIDGRRIYCTNLIEVLNPEMKEITTLGHVLDEGDSEIMTSIGLGEKIDCSTSKWAYGFNAYSLMCELPVTDVSYENYANYGFEYVVKKLLAEEKIELLQSVINIENGYNFTTFNTITDEGKVYFNEEAKNAICNLITYYYTEKCNEVGKEEARKLTYNLVNSYQNYILPVSAFDIYDNPLTIVCNLVGYGVALENINDFMDYLNNFVEKTY